jgi:hypothetical protein
MTVKDLESERLTKGQTFGWSTLPFEDGACADKAAAKQATRPKDATRLFRLHAISCRPFESASRKKRPEQRNGLSERRETVLVCSTLRFSKPVENHTYAVAVGSFLNVWSIAQTARLRCGTESSPSRAP